jgi:hypothetical protein
MLMNVKLIVIQLELNGIGYIMVLHSCWKFASNTWHTLIWKFEKCKPNSQKITWVWTYTVYLIIIILIEKKIEKQTSTFGILKTAKMGK